MTAPNPTPKIVEKNGRSDGLENVVLKWGSEERVSEPAVEEKSTTTNPESPDGDDKLKRKEELMTMLTNGGGPLPEKITEPSAKRPRWVPSPEPAEVPKPVSSNAPHEVGKVSVAPAKAPQKRQPLDRSNRAAKPRLSLPVDHRYNSAPKPTLGNRNSVSKENLKEYEERQKIERSWEIQDHKTYIEDEDSEMNEIDEDEKQGALGGNKKDTCSVV
ncbi:hypothetical protein EDC01DRAFT_790204 [Geopyxis carbonaria]|nr:hypothetical protein EDC01DRAFT_790204 [Geopyxis carbonaria]